MGARRGCAGRGGVLSQAGRGVMWSGHSQITKLIITAETQRRREENTKSKPESAEEAENAEGAADAHRKTSRLAKIYKVISWSYPCPSVSIRGQIVFCEALASAQRAWSATAGSSDAASFSRGTRNWGSPLLPMAIATLRRNPE